LQRSDRKSLAIFWASVRTRPMYEARAETLIAPAASSWLKVCEHFRT